MGVDEIGAGGEICRFLPGSAICIPCAFRPETEAVDEGASLLEGEILALIGGYRSCAEPVAPVLPLPLVGMLRVRGKSSRFLPGGAICIPRALTSESKRPGKRAGFLER